MSAPKPPKELDAKNPRIITRDIETCFNFPARKGVYHFQFVRSLIRLAIIGPHTDSRIG
jgi:hypothetical protein